MTGSRVDDAYPVAGHGTADTEADAVKLGGIWCCRPSLFVSVRAPRPPRLLPDPSHLRVEIAPLRATIRLSRPRHIDVTDVSLA